MAKHDIYCKCNSCRRRRSILGDTQTLTNRTQVVPSKPLNPMDLDKAYGYFPEDGTYDEWRRTLKGEPGEDGAGIEIKENVETYADLLAITDPQIGDSYAVLGTGPDAQALLYTYGKNGWPAEGKGIPIQGTPGAPGEPGTDGTDGDTYIPMFADEFNQVNN